MMDNLQRANLLEQVKSFLMLNGWSYSKVALLAELQRMARELRESVPEMSEQQVEDFSMLFAEEVARS